MKALFCVVVLLTLPSVAHALPFVPSHLEASSLEARFVETGTNTACVNCGDLDPTNDLTLTLSGYSAAGVDGFGDAGGFMAMTGFLESIRDADSRLNTTFASSAITALGLLPKRWRHIRCPV